MFTKKLTFLLLLTGCAASAFAQEQGEPVTPHTGNTYILINMGPQEQGEPVSNYKHFYREDYLHGKEAGWRGEINTQWQTPTQETLLQNNKETAFDTDTAYSYLLAKPALIEKEGSYRVKDFEPNGERLPSNAGDGGDTPDNYIPWKGRVDFKFTTQQTDKGTVLQITSHIANPHGVRLQKATIKIKETESGVTVEIKLPKAERITFLGKPVKLKYDVVSYEEETAKKQEAAVRLAQDMLKQLAVK